MHIYVLTMSSPNISTTGFIFGEEVGSTYICTIRRLQVGMHLVLISVATRVFIIPLSSCHAALTSRVVWDMCKAMGTKFLQTHAVRELSCLGNSPLFYFFLLIVDPHYLMMLFFSGLLGYAMEWRNPAYPLIWAYRISASIRKLFPRCQVRASTGPEARLELRSPSTSSLLAQWEPGRGKPVDWLPPVRSESLTQRSSS